MVVKGGFYDQGERVYEVTALGSKNANIRVFDKHGTYLGCEYVQVWDIDATRRVKPKSYRRIGYTEKGY